MTRLRPLHKSELQYDHVIGTGGIGSGIFFSLQGNHTLGRNESRMASLQPYRDYCKQHIVLHYIAVLLKDVTNSDFRLFPIGKVGNDDIGKQLILQMQNAGMHTENIGICAGHRTLFSVCYQYPDHTGGNITTENSASAEVNPEDISRFYGHYDLNGEKGIAIAVPEVPLQTRIKLLESGKKKGNLTVASLSVSETGEFENLGGFQLADILALNMDEARSIARIASDAAETKKIVGTCIDKLVQINPDVTLLISDGGKGCYCYHRNAVEFVPALETRVVSTAGAGDAFLAGALSGICCGLPLQKGSDTLTFGEVPLQTAVELGVLLASLSVTSEDTIHPDANAKLLYEYAREKGLVLGPGFKRIFSECLD